MEKLLENLRIQTGTPPTCCPHAYGQERHKRRAEWLEGTGRPGRANSRGVSLCSPGDCWMACLSLEQTVLQGCYSYQKGTLEKEQKVREKVRKVRVMPLISHLHTIVLVWAFCSGTIINRSFFQSQKCLVLNEK